MEFLGMGMWEILLIIVIALIIWGPEKLPDIVRTLGRTVRALRKATSDITTAVTKEINMEEKDLSSQARENISDKTKQPLETGATQAKGTEATNPKDEQGPQQK